MWIPPRSWVCNAQLLTHSDCAEAHLQIAECAAHHGGEERKSPLFRSLHADWAGSLAMDSKYDEFRRNALVCMRLSKSATTPDMRASWLVLAEAWLEMIPQATEETIPLAPVWKHDHRDRRLPR